MQADVNLRGFAVNLYLLQEPEPEQSQNRAREEPEQSQSRSEFEKLANSVERKNERVRFEQGSKRPLKGPYNKKCSKGLFEVFQFKKPFTGFTQIFESL